MDLLLNEEQVLLRDAAAKLGASRGGPRRARALARCRRPRSIAAAWAEMIKAGWLSALVAEKDDGLGLGMFDLALALEETGKQIVMAPLVEAAAAIWAVTSATDAAPSGAGADRSRRSSCRRRRLPGQRYDSAAGVTFDPKASALSGAVSFVPFGASSRSVSGRCEGGRRNRAVSRPARRGGPGHRDDAECRRLDLEHADVLARGRCRRRHRRPRRCGCRRP